MEKWEDIILQRNGTNYDFSGIYQISTKGEVKNIKTGRILKPNSNGKYLFVELYKNGKRARFKVHILVATMFIPNPYNKPEVNHKDGNKLNNEKYNLEWCTQSENDKHAYKLGLKTSPSKGKFGSEHCTSKKVLQYTLNGILIKEWGSISEAHRELGINIGNITSCCKGKLTQAGGYIWKYKDIL